MAKDGALSGLTDYSLSDLQSLVSDPIGTISREAPNIYDRYTLDPTQTITTMLGAATGVPALTTGINYLGSQVSGALAGHASKAAAGVPGYEMGTYQGQPYSVVSGIFGRTITGNVPPGFTVDDHDRLVRERRERLDKEIPIYTPPTLTKTRTGWAITDTDPSLTEASVEGVEGIDTSSKGTVGAGEHSHDPEGAWTNEQITSWNKAGQPPGMTQAQAQQLADQARTDALGASLGYGKGYDLSSEGLGYGWSGGDEGGGDEGGGDEGGWGDF